MLSLKVRRWRATRQLVNALSLNYKQNQPVVSHLAPSHMTPRTISIHHEYACFKLMSQGRTFQQKYGQARHAIQNERRLAAVRGTGLLDSEVEEAFDRLTRLAVRLVKIPAAFVSLVDHTPRGRRAHWTSPLPDRAKQIPAISLQVLEHGNLPIWLRPRFRHE